MRTSILVVFIFFSSLAFSNAERLSPPAGAIPPMLFGMHMHGMALPRPNMKTPGPWPPIPFATWRLWDAYVDWPHLEPDPGKWDFAVLDRYVSLAEEHGVEILLPLGMTPAWASSRPDDKSAYGAGNAALPSSLEDWKTYVRTVAARYKGRIHCYEIWNEPNLQSFFSGTPEDMVVLTRAAREALNEVDPAVTVVSPAATGVSGVRWLDKFLQKGGGDYVDVIGFHAYVSPNPPEQMVSLIRSVREVMSKNGQADRQLWNTESGWRIANRDTVVEPEGSGFSSKVLTQDEASAYVARSYLLLWSSGVSRFYWYAWDDGVMGLTEADGRTLKPPAMAYGEVEKWLAGARMQSCISDSGGTWTCRVTRPGGYQGWIVWNPGRTLDFQLPKAWGVRDLRDLTGNRKNIVNTKVLKIGSMPVMLESPAQ